MKKLRKILLALTLGASVLITGCSSENSTANGNGNGGIFGNNENNNNNGNNENNNNNGNNGNNNNNGNNGNNNNNGNNGNNNNNNLNTGNGGGSAFTVNGNQLNIVNAVYSRDDSTTAVLFEGTLNDNAMLVIAATTGSFDDSATYMQRDFGNTIEVVVCLLNTGTAEYVAGSSATSGITNAQITTNANMTVSVSGTLVSDVYGNMPFAVSSVVTGTQMENISDKINAYDQFVSSANGNTGGNGGGNTGGNTGTTNRCPDCRGLRNCRSCSGDGTCHICVEGMTHCLSCNGSRVCQHCRGQRICPYCNGTGYV